MASSTESEIPQWKKDLIARLRNQNKQTAIDATGSGRQQQLCNSPPQCSSTAVVRAGQQPSLTCESVAAAKTGPSVVKCNVLSTTCLANKTSEMVQERVWVDDNYEEFGVVTESLSNGRCQKDPDSDSSEDLHYGPGIVSKLKNKYLSLALRENVRVRPSLHQMRKATSLENMLDDEVPNGDTTTGNRLFEPRMNGTKDAGRNVSNRYRNVQRGELKRARSVETISLGHDHLDLQPMRMSLHEAMLIGTKEGNDKPHRMLNDNKPEIIENKFSNSLGHRINRPKRIAPIMNEREKPPTDVVKQAKMIFEKRPEQRTKPPPATGEVAAKVDSFNSIIVKAKANKKPAIKHKPVLADKIKSNTPIRLPKSSTREIVKLEPSKNGDVANKVPKHKISIKDTPSPLPSPIPDVSRVEFLKNKGDNDGRTPSSLSQTPDLILTSSPISSLQSPVFKKTTENFLDEEIRHSTENLVDDQLISSLASSISQDEDEADSPGYKTVSPQILKNIGTSGTSIFNFLNTAVSQEHLPINKNISNMKTPVSQPLKLEINGFSNIETKKDISPSSTEGNKITSPKLIQQASPIEKLLSPVRSPKIITNTEPPKPNLTIIEREKNLKNTAKTLQQPKQSVSDNTSVQVNKNFPKVTRKPSEPVSNTAVFNFTDRKDVPDYISNDTSRVPERPALPKPGQGGVVLLPNVEFFSEIEDEIEILKSLEGPPSPCDVTFINDNILIDGKSSLSKNCKKAKMKISFLEEGPEIYEYPSETSLMIDDLPTSPVNNAQLGHTVPNLAGTTLANYTPKTTEDFQPGVTRSTHNIPTKQEETATPEPSNEEIEKPILFSAGTNSDMLF